MRLVRLLPITIIFVSLAGTIYLLSDITAVGKNITALVFTNSRIKPNNTKVPALRINGFAHELKFYASKKNYNTNICFIVDMSLHSGKNRFFVYDLKNDSIKYAGLVAHGSCNTSFLADAKFSNKSGCGCSSLGKYKVEYQYKGRFGKAFKLSGLDASNNNAFKRNVVLHAYSCVPDKETYPQPICNSLGCPMVSYAFLKKLLKDIKISKKPILLWIVN